LGTFLAQAVATGYVGRIAGDARAAASGLYLASYFLGGLFGTLILGALYDRLGWVGCVSGIGLALIVAIGLTAALTAETEEPIA
jgi:MFS family permease